jgi:hypothetical protein
MPPVVAASVELVPSVGVGALPPTKPFPAFVAPAPAVDELVAWLGSVVEEPDDSDVVCVGDEDVLRVMLPVCDEDSVVANV